MARRAEPDYVSGEKGRYEIAPPIVHPAHCVCDLCPKRRAAPADWLKPITIRSRRKSPYPSSRIDSAAYARQFKREEEARLVAAVEEAERQKRARAGAVTFGRVCDAYRDHQKAEGKRFDRDQYRIAAAEEYFGRSRDAASLDREGYAAWRAHLAKNGAAASTIARHTTTLVAMMNHAVREQIITSHNLTHLQRPKVRKKTKPVTFTRRQVAVLLGRAMDAYEREQARTLQQWQREQEARAAERRPQLTTKAPSVVPLRGFCLIAYLTLMRPENNFSLRWEQLSIDARKDLGRFRLDEHKNSSKGVEVEGGLHPALVRYLRPIWRGRMARGLVHPSPATGEPYVNIRAQWARLLEIANGMLPPDEQLTGVRQHFYTWRHTGASELAANGGDPVMIARMMGDTSLKTVMDHYFDSSVEHMQEILAKWEPPIGEDASGRKDQAIWAN